MDSLFTFLGGLGLFLVGMQVLTDGLKGLAEETLRKLLVRFTQSPLSGAVTGAMATAILQSSSATTVAAVGFVGAGLLSFHNGTTYEGGVSRGRYHGRGVLREVVDGRFGFEAGTEYLAEVLDSEGRLVRSRRLALSEFGTVHDELILPLAAPLGTWTVRLSRPSGATYQGRFQVQVCFQCDGCFQARATR